MGKLAYRFLGEIEVIKEVYTSMRILVDFTYVHECVLVLLLGRGQQLFGRRSTSARRQSAAVQDNGYDRLAAQAQV